MYCFGAGRKAVLWQRYAREQNLLQDQGVKGSRERDREREERKTQCKENGKFSMHMKGWVRYPVDLSSMKL